MPSSPANAGASASTASSAIDGAPQASDSFDALEPAAPELRVLKPRLREDRAAQVAVVEADPLTARPGEIRLAEVARLERHPGEFAEAKRREVGRDVPPDRIPHLRLTKLHPGQAPAVHEHAGQRPAPDDGVGQVRLEEDGVRELGRGERGVAQVTTREHRFIHAERGDMDSGPTCSAQLHRCERVLVPHRDTGRHLLERLRQSRPARGGRYGHVGSLGSTARLLLVDASRPIDTGTGRPQNRREPERRRAIE